MFLDVVDVFEMVFRVEAGVERQLPHIIPKQQQPETGNDEQERCFQPSRCRFLKADIPEKDGYRSNRNKNNPERPDLLHRIKGALAATNKISGTGSLRRRSEHGMTP